MLSIVRLDRMVLATAASDAASHELTAAKAVILGIVEGVTEYLPISSTGHLLVTQKLLGVGDTDATKDAADTYAITIQAGAILAVVVLYFAALAVDGVGTRRSRRRTAGACSSRSRSRSSRPRSSASRSRARSRTTCSASDR